MTIRPFVSALAAPIIPPHASLACLIETLPRRGYRFIAKMDGASTTTAPPPRRADRRPIVAAVALVFVVAAVWAFAAAGRSVNRNVAIMPLVPKPGDPPWVADVGSQIVERLVVQLTAQAPAAIGVVGPLTTQRFVGDTRPLAEIGRSLDVGYMLSGGVRASDSTVFIQVVRIADGVHVCAFRRRAVGADLDALASLIASGTTEKILALRPGQGTDFNCTRR